MMRSWIEHSVLPQSDGMYLVRLLGRRLVYRVDQATKERFVSFTNRVCVISVVPIAIVLIDSFLPRAWQYGQPEALLSVLTLDLGFLLAVLLWSRHFLGAGNRVAPDLWTGPDPLALWPYRLRMAWLAAGAASIIWIFVLFRHYPGVSWVPIAALVLFLVLVLRRRRELFRR